MADSCTIALLVRRVRDVALDRPTPQGRSDRAERATAGTTSLSPDRKTATGELAGSCCVPSHEEDAADEEQCDGVAAEDGKADPR